MSWIDERQAESEAHQARNRTIEESAASVFESLWKEVNEFILEAKEKGFKDLSTNGSPYDRTVAAPVTPKPQDRGRAGKQLRISLKDKRMIVASAPGVDAKFEIDVRDDGVVCMKIDGAEISIRDAAIKILDPFLFPELTRKF